MAQKKVLVLDKDKQQINPSTEESVMETTDAIVLLRRMVKLMESNATVNAQNMQRVEIYQPAAASLLATTVGQTTLVYGGPTTLPSAGIDSRWTLVDQARNAYANGIRSKLNWS